MLDWIEKVFFWNYPTFIFVAWFWKSGKAECEVWSAEYIVQQQSIKFLLSLLAPHHFQSKQRGSHMRCKNLKKEIFILGKSKIPTLIYYVQIYIWTAILILTMMKNKKKVRKNSTMDQILRFNNFLSLNMNVFSQDKQNGIACKNLGTSFMEIPKKIASYLNWGWHQTKPQVSRLCLVTARSQLIVKLIRYVWL